MSFYVKLEDASSLLFPTGERVETATEYLGWQAAHIAQRRIARVWNTNRTVKARINHGRWITDCVHCYQGIYTHPEWRIACCAQCGAVYRGVEFPDDAALKEITRLMLERPDPTKMNWDPGEPLWKLRLENRLHGLLT